MARYTKEHKQETRQRIIATASRRLKRDGIDGSGVATLMKDADLTNGAFYAHFESKDSLVVEAVTDQLHLSEPSQSAILPPRWAGAIDSVGSHTLVNVLAQTQYGGTVASFGLAQGIDLPGTVLPFIGRSVTLAGVDSVNAPSPKRVESYQRLATDLDVAKLESMVTVVGLAEAADVARSIFGGTIRGRVVVDVNA